MGAYTFCGCILSGRDLEVGLQNVLNEVVLIVEVLKESLEARLSFLSDDPLLSAASVLLNASSYKNHDKEFILKAVKKVYEHFVKPLEENDFIKSRLGESNFEKKIYIRKYYNLEVYLSLIAYFNKNTHRLPF